MQRVEQSCAQERINDTVPPPAVDGNAVRPLDDEEGMMMDNSPVSDVD